MNKRIADHLMLVTAIVGAVATRIAADTPTTTSAGIPGPRGTTPPYSLVRYSENYSYLKDPAERTDVFDPIKFIPLRDNGDTYLSLGGQLRERYEFFNNNTFGAGPQDENGYYLTRLIAHADLHVSESFRGFLELKSAMLDNREGGPRASDADEFDLQQAFADFRIPLRGGEGNSLTLRGGRQELTYGAQRVIGVGDWTNTRRAFEGVNGIWLDEDNRLDVFWVRPVIVEKEEPNSGDGNSSFAGAYDSLALPDLLGPQAGTKLESYFLVLNKTKAPAVDTAAAAAVDSDIYTVGARFVTKPSPFDLDVEGAYQFGKSDDGDISAYSIAVESGFSMRSEMFSPRLFAGFDYASGDDDPGDPDNQTYNQLFPTGHLYFGYIDVIGRQNIIDVHPGIELLLLKDLRSDRKLLLRAEYHHFWRASTHDAVYNATGGITRAAADGNDEAEIGGEIDLLLSWQFDRHLSGYVGYSHFFPGDFIQDTGPSGDIDFFYAAMVYTF